MVNLIHSPCAALPSCRLCCRSCWFNQKTGCSFACYCANKLPASLAQDSGSVVQVSWKLGSIVQTVHKIVYPQRAYKARKTALFFRISVSPSFPFVLRNLGAGLRCPCSERPVVCWDSPCAGPRRGRDGYVRIFILFSVLLSATSWAGSRTGWMASELIWSAGSSAAESRERRDLPVHTHSAFPRRFSLP